MGAIITLNKVIFTPQSRIYFSDHKKFPLQENRSMATKPFVAQKSQFHCLMYQRRNNTLGDKNCFVDKCWSRNSPGDEIFLLLLSPNTFNI